MEKFVRERYMKPLIQSAKTERLVLLTGARQVGKTTLLRQLEASLKTQGEMTLFLNFEDFWASGKALFDSKEHFLRFVSREYGADLTRWKTFLFLDEVQYAPDAVSFLKSLYDDQHLDIVVFATGSRFLGQKRLGSGLVGRGRTMRVFPFTCEEFIEAKGRKADLFFQSEGVVESDFLQDTISEYRQFGGYPAVVFANGREAKVEALSRIVSRIFETDLLFVLKWEESIHARHIFSFLAENIGNKAKIENIATQFHLSSKRVIRILDFFADSFLLHEVYPYFTDRTREYSDRPKIYLHDIGLLNFIRGNFPSTNSADGKITENILANELMSVLREGDALSFYKKTNGSEIDFILRQIRTGKFFAIEAKSGNKDIIPRIFHSFREAYPETNGWLVSTESLFRTRDDIRFVPYWYIAKILYP